MLSLAGKTAIITGASRGIGAAIAREFARNGANVVVTARSSNSNPGKLPGSIDEIANELTQKGARALAIQADLSQAADRERIFNEATQHFGQVDILVNNAAVTYFSPLSTLELRRLNLMHEIQVVAPLHLSQLVLPGMRERKSGWILNISSAEAEESTFPPSRFAQKGLTTGYGITKSALERMTSGLAAEFYKDGILISALKPSGLVPTPGIVFHGMLTEDDPRGEDPAIMATAAVRLCSAIHPEFTGSVHRSTDIARRES